MGLKNMIFGRTKDNHVQETKRSKTSNMMMKYHAAGPIFTPRRYDRLADEGYMKNNIVHRCVKLIAQNAASVPWKLYRVEQGKKTALLEHDLLTLLQKPNPMQGQAEFFENIFSYYLIAGNSYIEAVGPDGARPFELWSLRPDRMRILAGRNAVPHAYRYEVNGQYHDFKINDMTGDAPILHLKSFHPLDDYYGASALEAAAYSIDQHNEASKWNTSLLQNAARPSGALIYNPKDASMSDRLTDEQRETLKTELEYYHQSADHAGSVMVLEGGLDWRDMSLSPKDMDWLAGKDVSARDIAMAFHVPPQLVGVEGSMTYANFEQARLALYDDAILPLLKHVRDELNKWLTVKFDTNLMLDFDLDQIEALAPRRERVWKRVQGASFMTINEKRQVLGLSAIENGDQLGQVSDV